MLTGTTYIRNAIKFDFPIEECIKSLAPICEEIICLECESGDETLDLLYEIKKDVDQLKIVEGVKWDISYKFDRLRALSDHAASIVKTPYRFHLQADEVIHENSYLAIRQFQSALEVGVNHDSCYVNRFNIFGTFDHFVNPRISRAPCSSKIVRLGTNKLRSIGDDESLGAVSTCNAYYKDINVFHYSFVRKPEVLVAKSIDMQTWFHGNKSAVDQRLFKAQEIGFNPYDFIPKDDLYFLPMLHPKVAHNWVKDRRKFYEV